MSLDDDFGGFEEAPTSIALKQESISNSNLKSHLPDWLLTQPSLPTPTSTSNIKTDPNNDLIKQLQDELTKTKEQLLDQQTNNLQLQAQQRQDNDAISKIYSDIQHLMHNQKESLTKEFRILQNEQERKFMQQIREINSNFEKNLNEKFEQKLAEFQENLIKHYESEFEDLELKIKKIINSTLKDEHFNDNFKSKIENDLKTSTEKYVQNFFRNQSEVFKEQIKSGVLQEHLIHRDMINNKLDKLFRSSEEKRRKTNLLFAKHMSGLNFFVDNAHKQLTVLRDAYQDMVKNKELIDYYGDENVTGTENSSEIKPSSLSSLSSLSLSTLGFGLGQQTKNNQSLSKDNLFEIEDENLIDENLI